MNTFKTQHQSSSANHESQQPWHHWGSDVRSPYQAEPTSQRRFVIAYEDLYTYGFPIAVGLFLLSLLFVAAIYYGWINP